MPIIKPKLIIIDALVQINLGFSALATLLTTMSACP